MPTLSDYKEDFQENLDALLSDVILLDAFAARDRKDLSPLLRGLPPEYFDQTHQQLLYYLIQHSTDLYSITQYIKEAQGA